MTTPSPFLPIDIDPIAQAPVRLQPDNFMHNMWGGDWITRFKNLPPSVRPIGESWEFSTHRDRPTRIQLSNNKTASLFDLISSYPEQILGQKLAEKKSAPFLLKFIDPRDDLSVQVHPTEKSEAWYILDVGAEVGEGVIYLGFNPAKAAGYASTEEFEEAFLSAILQANSQGPIVDAAQREKAARLVLPFLNRIAVRPGEAYRVNPGTIHAIGKGVRLFEIQETSDLTYRLWDWNRPDADKLKDKKLEFRPLHLDQAKKVLDYRPQSAEHYRMARRPVATEKSVREDVVIEEENHRFATHLITLPGRGREAVLKTNGAFLVLTGVAGSTALSFARQANSGFESWGELARGRTVLVPARVAKIKLIAQSETAEILKSYCPA